MFRMQSGAFLHEETAMVAYWNSSTLSWDSDGISDVEIDKGLRNRHEQCTKTEADTGMVKFQTMHFAPTTVVQNAFIEFPYASWLSVPQGPNHAHLTLKGKVNTVTIAIKGSSCQLVEPRVAATADLNSSWFSPNLLLRVSKI